MEKIAVIISVILLGNIFNADAQVLYLGLNGGYLKNAKIIDKYNISPGYLQDTESPTLLNSYMWGVNFGYKPTHSWSFETQLQFTNEGYKEAIDIMYGYQSDSISYTAFTEVDWYYNYYYVRIPILAHFHFFPSTSRFGLGLMAGPNLGFLIKQTSEFEGNELGVGIANTLGLKDKPLKKLDFGYQLGLRVQSKLSNSVSFFLEGTVYHGFESIIDYPNHSYNQPTPSYFYDIIINRHFTANIGFQLNLWTKTPSDKKN